ncbi:hypothetical protein H0H92_000713, partial [Tricholoma furcatifolium]
GKAVDEGGRRTAQGGTFSEGETAHRTRIQLRVASSASRSCISGATAPQLACTRELEAAHLATVSWSIDVSFPISAE